MVQDIFYYIVFLLCLYSVENMVACLLRFPGCFSRFIFIWISSFVPVSIVPVPRGPDDSEGNPSALLFIASNANCNPVTVAFVCHCLLPLGNISILSCLRARRTNIVISPVKPIAEEGCTLSHILIQQIFTEPLLCVL